MIDASTSTAATTLTTGAWFGRERFWKIQIGRVVTPGGAVNRVTTISSNDSPNARSAPATSAPRRSGKVTRRNVVNVSAPRSIDASSARGAHPPQPRQDVVVDDHDAERRVRDGDGPEATAPSRGTCGTPVRKASAVTMPGRAIGSTTSRDTVCLPKNVYRPRANARSMPSTSATAGGDDADLDRREHGGPDAVVAERERPPVRGERLAGARRTRCWR